MKQGTVRGARLVFGLFMYALGSYLNIQANIGLAPWEAFSMGLFYVTGISYGDVVVLSGLVILVIDVLLKEKVGLGTLLNVVLIGKFIDLLRWLNPMPSLTNFWAGVGLLLIGQVCIAVGSFFYIGAGLGCGPRDSLMVALGKRLPKLPIGAIRGIIEATVLLVGYLMGAKVGFGTVIAVFGISFILQATFKLLRFDVKGVRHDSLADTGKQFKALALAAARGSRADRTL